MNLLLPGVMDSLATGALLCYAVKFHTATSAWKAFVRLRPALLLLSLGLIVGLQFLGDDLLIKSLCSEPGWDLFGLLGRHLN